MKYTLVALALALLPYSLSAQEESATGTPAVPPVALPAETISVSLHVRHKDLLVYTGTVELEKGSSVSVSDNSGTPRALPSVAALAALVAADAASPEFAITDLIYYAGFDSLYVRCLEIASLGKSACDNWQYVVNASYPPVGADDYTLSEGDSIYFYFGVPRRVMLLAAETEKTAPVSVKAESYDYTNDTWKPLSGTTVGATKPNPSDPYSPEVVSQAISDENGIASFTLDTGSYGIGLAADFYAFLESLEVREPAPAPEAAVEPVVERVSRSGGSSLARAVAATLAIEATATDVATSSPVDAIATSTPLQEPLIALGMSVGEFTERYALFSKAYQSVPLAPRIAADRAPETETPASAANSQSQTASVIGSSIRSDAQNSRSWFSRLLGIFGI